MVFWLVRSIDRLGSETASFTVTNLSSVRHPPVAERTIGHSPQSGAHCSIFLGSKGSLSSDFLHDAFKALKRSFPVNFPKS